MSEFATESSEVRVTTSERQWGFCTRMAAYAANLIGSSAVPELRVTLPVSFM